MKYARNTALNHRACDMLLFYLHTEDNDSNYYDVIWFTPSFLLSYNCKVDLYNSDLATVLLKFCSTIEGSNPTCDTEGMLRLVVLQVNQVCCK